MTAITTATTITSTNTATHAGILPAITSFLAGLALIFVVGFSHIEAVHNGAHDTRHASAFPCH